METLTTSSVLLSLASVLVVIWVIKAVNRLWLKPKMMEDRLRQQGVPGTSYRFFSGDLKGLTVMRARARQTPMDSISHDYFRRIEPFCHQFITKLNTDVRKGYFIWLGAMPMVNISNPDMIAEAFTKRTEFQKPKFSPITSKLFPGLLTAEGDKWAKHRRIINPAFRMEKLKFMLPGIHLSCFDLINKWKKIVAETGSTELDVWPHLQKLAADVISRAAFGSSYIEGQRIFQIITEQTDLNLRMEQSVYIPGWRYVPTKSNRRFKELEDQIHSLLTKIINKRKEAMDAGEAAKDDLLGILMDSNKKEMQQSSSNKMNLKLGLNLQEVIDECKVFYLTGHEPVSALLVWTVILLGKHTDWQAQARKEVFEVFGNCAPDFEGLSRLKTVTMILYEVLRLYTPLVQLRRKINKDVMLGDVSLPAGALTCFSFFHVHRDKDLWGDHAEEFNPQRFAEGLAKASNGKTAFFPFGWGPRICIGEKFGMMEAKMALSMILQNFDIELSPSYIHAPTLSLIVQPQHGAHVILRKL